MDFGTVRMLVVAAVVVAGEPMLDASRVPQIPTCIRCGRQSHFVRHVTLAKRAAAKPWS
jgi:hypothetical protein